MNWWNLYANCFEPRSESAFLRGSGPFGRGFCNHRARLVFERQPYKQDFALVRCGPNIITLTEKFLRRLSQGIPLNHLLVSEILGSDPCAISSRSAPALGFARARFVYSAFCRLSFESLQLCVLPSCHWELESTLLPLSYTALVQNCN